PGCALFPYTTLFRSAGGVDVGDGVLGGRREVGARDHRSLTDPNRRGVGEEGRLHVVRPTVGVCAVAVDVVIGSVGPVTGSVATIDRKSTRLNSSHVK